MITLDRPARVLVVVAHADDETIGCGGTIAKLVRMGHSVEVLLPIKRIDARGVREWDNLLTGFHQACEVLGASATVAERLIPEDEAHRTPAFLNDAILPNVERADLILSHHPGDVNYVHRAVANAVEVTTRPFRRNKSVWLFPVATTTDQGFFNTYQPNLHVVLSAEDLERKTRAMSHYSSELEAGRTPDDLRLLAQLTGRQIGTEYAESFQIVHEYM
jgi:LmbE family N-acetylglucosaminyl deacetylase